MAQNLRDVVRDSVVERLPVAVDDRERESIARFLTEFDSLAHPFTEEAAITHVTGSGIVVGKRGVLLHLHKRAQIWIQPGGHVDAGEMPWEGAVRETSEETGITACHPDDGPVLIHVDVHDAPKGHLHLDLRYLLLGPDETPTPPPGESPHVEWFAFDHEHMQRHSLGGAVKSAQRWLAAHPQQL